jgi:N6-adenosine-specific RNA methylase IME4
VSAEPKKFGTIYADPAWSFLTYTKHRTTLHRGVHEHYGVMTQAELMALPVSDMAADDAALFMWVVDSHFDEALALGRAWGFTFKTCAFVWVKTALDGQPRMSMGYWSRKETEQCWLFTRGKPRRIGKGVRQVIMAPRREHSRKPDETYRRIEALVGGPYIEMFARQRYPGWSQWGNQDGLMEVGRVAPPPPVTGPLLDIMQGRAHG